MTDWTAATCQHDDAYPAKMRGCNGAWRVGYWCPTCQRTIKRPDRPGLWLPIAGWDLDVIPEEREPVLETCQHCKRTEFCEWHHYAPKKFFGADAEKWPQGWLCVPCHEYWHDRIGQPIRVKAADCADRYTVLP